MEISGHFDKLAALFTVSTENEAGRAQEPVYSLRKIEKYLASAENEPIFLSRPARSQTSVLTEIFRLL